MRNEQDQIGMSVMAGRRLHLEKVGVNRILIQKINLVVAMLLTFASVARCEDVDFQRDVLPILQEHCIDCHGPDEAESQLRLDSELSALRGGDSGERLIVPGKSSLSYLIERITTEDSDARMPPDESPLSEKQVQILRSWVDDTTRWKPVETKLASQKIDHWSLQPLVRPEVPDVGVTNPIDAFIATKLTENKLKNSKRASKRSLIRRLYLVMHGLPPTPEQVDSYLSNQHPDAWEALVDDVLKQPQYGERWATHWLDLVRFGETHGFETNRERPHAWRYRDWVINSFNSDKPYDKFIIQQIAGDAVGEEIGTGFLVAGPYDLVKGQDPAFRLIQRQDELADMINTTGTAFLGLTLGCARCHNHKFDPITQTDYYSLQAVFAGVDHADRSLPIPVEQKRKLVEVDKQIFSLEQKLAQFIPEKSPPGTRPAVTATSNVELFDPVDAKYIRFTISKTSSSQPCLDELEIFANGRNVALASLGGKASSSSNLPGYEIHKLEHLNDGKYGNSHSWISNESGTGWVQIEIDGIQIIDRIEWARDRDGRYSDRLATEYKIAVSLDESTWQVIASSKDRLPYKSGKQTKPTYQFDGVSPEIAKRGRAWLDDLNTLQARRSKLAEAPKVYAGTFHQPGPTHRLYRGEPSAPREEVVPAAIKALTDLALPANAPERDRRLAVAHWIANRDNSLTARVMVNRLWQHHFGTGLVDTPSDFGANGTLPTHPGLLDWLAAEFIDSGWSVKHIQKLILTSNTWQQESRPRSEAMAVDAASRLLWRFPGRRLEAEGIRDSILTVTGQIDLEMGGVGFSAFEIDAENVRHYFPKTDFGPADWRRMIYMTKVRQERDAVFGVFDCPDCSQVVPGRSRSTTPLQALNLLNSRFVLQQADFFVKRLESESKTTEEKIVRAYKLCFSRPPEKDEIETAIEFLEQSDWQQFARAMLNANEFVFIP